MFPRDPLRGTALEGTAAPGELCQAGSGGAGGELCSPCGSAASHTARCALEDGMPRLRFAPAAGDAALGVSNRGTFRGAELLPSGTQHCPRRAGRGGLWQARGDSPPWRQTGLGRQFCKSKRIKSLRPAAGCCFPQMARGVERQKGQGGVVLPGAGKFACPFSQSGVTGQPNLQDRGKLRNKC